MGPAAGFIPCIPLKQGSLHFAFAHQQSNFCGTPVKGGSLSRAGASSVPLGIVVPLQHAQSDDLEGAEGTQLTDSRLHKKKAQEERCGKTKEG